MKFQLVGPSYVSRSSSAACERSVNLYPEIIDDPAGKTRVALYGTPGLQLFATLPTGPIRAMGVWDVSNSLVSTPMFLAIGGSKLYEISLIGGGITEIGDIGGGTGKIQIAFNGNQFFIANARKGYVYDVNVWPYTFTDITDQLGDQLVNDPALCVGLDGYICLASSASRKLYISGLYDASTWDPLDFGVKESAADPIMALAADYGELWLLGSETSEVWGNAGNADFPFQPIRSAFMPIGISAGDTLAVLNRSLFWLGTSKSGGVIAYRSNGYSAVRISTEAVEWAWAQYMGAGAPEAYGDGDRWYIVSFPNGDATWVYDARNNCWHERASWDGAAYHRHWGRCRANPNFVGDYRNGKIYRQSENLYDDAGVPIRRLRRSPHISHEMQWLRHNRLWVDMEPGVDVAMNMKFSDDGGKTWSAKTYTDSVSSLDTRARVKWNRLGRSRDRVYDLFTTSAAPVVILDGYIEAGAGNGS